MKNPLNFKVHLLKINTVVGGKWGQSKVALYKIHSTLNVQPFVPTLGMLDSKTVHTKWIT